MSLWNLSKIVSNDKLQLQQCKYLKVFHCLKEWRNCIVWNHNVPEKKLMECHYDGYKINWITATLITNQILRCVSKSNNDHKIITNLQLSLILECNILYWIQSYHCVTYIKIFTECFAFQMEQIGLCYYLGSHD